MRIDQAKKADLETKAILVESELYNDVTYAIDREGKGMWIIVGNKIIGASEPVKWANEIIEVWEHMKPKGGK